MIYVYYLQNNFFKSISRTRTYIILLYIFRLKGKLQIKCVEIEDNLLYLKKEFIIILRTHIA